MQVVKSVVQRLLDRNVVSVKDLRPCTNDEILDLEKQLRIKVPSAYKEFLLVMGKGAGRFMEGTDMFFSQLLELQNDAIDLLEENGLKNYMPKNAFVFSMHQGYEFLYFIVDDEPDPPVYQYVEGIDKLELIWNSFTDFLEEMAAQHIDFIGKAGVNKES